MHQLLPVCGLAEAGSCSTPVTLNRAVASLAEYRDPRRRLLVDGQPQHDFAQEFGEQFECKAPSARKIKAAIAQTLARWPVGSLGEET